MGQLSKLGLFLHTFGVIVWVGSALSLGQLLCVHGKTGSGNEALSAAERRIAMAMDIGATLALIGGICLLLVTRSAGSAWALKQGWFHGKLLLLLGLFGLHGFLRVRVKRVRTGTVTPLPAWIGTLLWLLPIAIAGLAVFRPF